MMENRAKHIVGIDVGGTKIAAVLFDSNRNVIARTRTTTEADMGEKVVVQRIIDSIYRVMELGGISTDAIAGIGICCPGPLNISKGMIVYIATLGWKDVPLKQLIADEFKVPIYLENDANAAAYGEALVGAGKGYKNIIYITVSTGIGCGIILGGNIYHGKHDAAGEFGHICVEDEGQLCSCGKHGCLQAYASGTSIIRIAREKIAQGTTSCILELADFEPNAIDACTVEKAAMRSDKLACAIWKHAGRRFGHGISILMQLFDPDIVIIGGGVSKAWDLFYKPMVDAIKKNTYRIISSDMLIVPSQLGDDAGVTGAAMLVPIPRQ